MINIQKLREEKPLNELLNFSLINLDKPTGPTSFQVSQFVKRALNLKKTSHMGTLDPAVTGVLPITLGRACRLAEYFMHKNKTYIGVLRLHKDVPIEELKKAMKSFKGKITQLPPVRSSVKRQLREREIREFELLEKKERDVLFRAEVQAGTYIRTLCVDLGKKLGVEAHMLELRRIKAGLFSEQDSSFINLYDLEKAVQDEKALRSILIPAEVLALHLPVIQVKESSVKQILTGKPLHKQDIEGTLPKLEKEEKILIFHNQQFLQAARVINEGDIIAKADFVLN
nr:hypothetical protein [uncultured archaeon]AQS29497.1 hypothetical protein [uncultured archaeon]